MCFMKQLLLRDFFERNRRIHLSKPSKKEDVCLQKLLSDLHMKSRGKEKSFNRKLLLFFLGKNENPVKNEETVITIV